MPKKTLKSKKPTPVEPDEDEQQEEEETPQEKRATYIYPVPETREDFLALYQCLKDTGVNGAEDLQVRASRL